MFSIPTPAKTEAQHAAESAQAIAERSKRLINHIATEYNLMFVEFWRNDHASPQAMADAFGTQTVDLFTRSSQLATFLLSQQADILTEQDYSPPVPVTLNQDGTATIG